MRLSLILMALILTIYCNGQSSIKPTSEILPSDIYKHKRKKLLIDLEVEKQITIIYKNNHVDTNRITTYNKFGNEEHVKYKMLELNSMEYSSRWYCFTNIYDSETRELKSVEYCDGRKQINLNKKIRSKNSNYSEFIHNETVVFSPNDSILWRIRNRYIEEDQMFIHESINESSQLPSFRNIMKLDSVYNIVSSTVFDPKNSNSANEMESYYSINHYYNRENQRIKTVRYESNKLEPKITIYNYYQNGLLKSEERDSFTLRYEYEYKKQR